MTLPQDVAGNVSELKLMVLGLTEGERKMLDVVARLFQKRVPRLMIVGPDERDAADVFIVDGASPDAVRSMREIDPRGKRPTVWIDVATPRPGYRGVMRPVQWSLLPIMLARAMAERGEDHRVPTAAPRGGANAATHDARSKVLVVDDSLAVRNFIESAFGESNVDVEFAGSGEEAVAALAQHEFVCVFLDVVMPGMDGYAVCRHIKTSKVSEGAPAVVMLTSKSSPFDKIRGNVAGCDAYLTKPVEEEQLLRMLERYVPNSKPRAAAPSRAVAIARGA